MTPCPVCSGRGYVAPCARGAVLERHSCRCCRLGVERELALIGMVAARAPAGPAGAVARLRARMEAREVAAAELPRREAVAA